MRRASSTRAVVLGGGGVAGIAWETGLTAGLASAGVDLTDADLIVGTSAGATVAAQITSSASVPNLFDAQLNGTSAPEPHFDVDMRSLLREMDGILRNEPDPVEARRQVGEIALATDRVPEAERRAIIEKRLPSSHWPQQLVKLTAIDAATGEFVLLDRDSGVDLVDAVAASCAIPRVWPAVSINGRRYMDGGIRSTTNSDAANGFGRVLVIEAAKSYETSDVRPLTDKTLVVKPDESTAELFRTRLMDPAVRPASAQAGFDQGVALAARVGKFWGS